MYCILVKVHSNADADAGARKLQKQVAICGIQPRYIRGESGCALLTKECQIEFVNVSSPAAEKRMKDIYPDAKFRFNGGVLGKWRLGEFILELGQEGIEPDIFKLVVSKETEDAFYLYPTDLSPEKQEEMKKFLGEACFKDKKRSPLFVLCKPKKKN